MVGFFKSLVPPQADPTTTGSTGGGGSIFGNLFGGQRAGPDQYGYTDPLQGLGPIDRYRYFYKNEPDVIMSLAAGLLGGTDQTFAQGAAAAGEGMSRHRAYDQQMQDRQMGRNATREWLRGQIDPSTGKPFTEAAINAAMLNPAILTDLLTPKKNYIAVGDNIFDANTGQFISPAPGQGGMFTGKSVDAQALNWLVSNGKISPEQAANAAAGKPITGSDGSIYWFNPGALSGQGQLMVQEPGQAPRPVETGDGAAAPGTGASTTIQPPAGTQQVAGNTVGTEVAPGVTRLTGAKQKDLTEFQRKNKELYSVAAPELKTALDNFDSLTSVWNTSIEKAKNAPYVGGVADILGNYATSKEYQNAKQAVRTIVQSYLYSSSGATANPGELATTTENLTPKPGAKNIDEMKARLGRFVKAIQIAAETGERINEFDPRVTGGQGGGGGGDHIPTYNPVTKKIE